MTKKILLETLKEGDKYYNISDVYSLKEDMYVEDEDGEMIVKPVYQLERVKEEFGYDVVLNQYKKDNERYERLDELTTDREQEIKEMDKDLEELRTLQDTEITDYNSLGEKLDEKEKTGFIKAEDVLSRDNEEEEESEE